MRETLSWEHSDFFPLIFWPRFPESQSEELHKSGLSFVSVSQGVVAHHIINRALVVQLEHT